MEPNLATLQTISLKNPQFCIRLISAYLDYNVNEVMFCLSYFIKIHIQSSWLLWSIIDYTVEVYVVNFFFSSLMSSADCVPLTIASDCHWINDPFTEHIKKFGNTLPLWWHQAEILLRRYLLPLWGHMKWWISDVLQQLLSVIKKNDADHIAESTPLTILYYSFPITVLSRGRTSSAGKGHEDDIEPQGKSLGTESPLLDSSTIL